MAILLLPAKALPEIDRTTRRSLNNSIVDGYLWSFMFGFGEVLIQPFAVFFNASVLLVSLMTGAAQAGISISNILGASFIRNYRKRKTLSMITNIIHASSYLFMFWLTVTTKDPIVVIIFFVFGLMATSFASSGWMSWMNEIVPPETRGRFWAYRNRYIVLAQNVAIPLGALVLYLFKKNGVELWGYGLLFTLAFVFRALSFIPLSRQHEPVMEKVEEKDVPSFFDFLFSLSKSNYGKFVLFNILFTFAMNIMPALTAIHLLKAIKLTSSEFLLTIMASTVASFLMMTYWGKFTDKYGNYRVLAFTAAGIMLLPLGWTFFHSFWAFIVLNFMGGFFWSGFGLATQNFMFDNLAQREVNHNFAYFNVLNNITAFLAAVTGGILAKLFGTLAIDHVWIFKITSLKLEFIFLLSFLLRLAVILFLLKSFKEILQKENVSNPIHIFVVQPLLEIFDPVRIVSLAKETVQTGVKTIWGILSPKDDKPASRDLRGPKNGGDGI
jgi:MFS family permease